MQNDNDKPQKCKPIGDHTIELTTRELYQQLMRDQQDRPRQRSPLLDQDPRETADLGALFRVIRNDNCRGHEAQDGGDSPTLDATLP